MFAVRSLYSLQKFMIATPCWPKAGPIGGAGVALPAAICNFTYARTRLAILPPRFLYQPGTPVPVLCASDHRSLSGRIVLHTGSDRRETGGRNAVNRPSVLRLSLRLQKV